MSVQQSLQAFFALRFMPSNAVSAFSSCFFACRIKKHLKALLLLLKLNFSNAEFHLDLEKEIESLAPLKSLKQYL